MDTNWSSAIMHMLDKFVKLVLINCLWFLYTLLGAVVLGLMPATASASILVRKMIKNEEIESVNKSFWYYYKQSFRSINLIGALLWVFAIFLYLDIAFLIGTTLPIGKVLLAGVFMLSFVYFAVILHLFPLYSRFKMKTFGYLKAAFVMAMTHPFITLLMVVWLVIVYVLSIAYTVIIPLMGMVMLLLGINWLSIIRIEKFDHKLLNNNAYDDR